MSHSQAHCSRNTIAVAVQCAEIAHLLWLQVGGYPIEKIEKDRYGNGVCVQNGGKSGAMRLAGRGKREARREPFFPAIQFSTNILRAATLRRFIHQVVQNAKKGIERGNLMPMLRTEKARGKMKRSSMRCQKPFIRICCSGDEALRRDNCFPTLAQFSATRFLFIYLHKSHMKLTPQSLHRLGDSGNASK